jgi:hypothetical protein
MIPEGFSSESDLELTQFDGLEPAKHLRDDGQYDYGRSLFEMTIRTPGSAARHAHAARCDPARPWSDGGDQQA